MSALSSKTIKFLVSVISQKTKRASKSFHSLYISYLLFYFRWTHDSLRTRGRLHNCGIWLREQVKTTGGRTKNKTFNKTEGC